MPAGEGLGRTQTGTMAVQQANTDTTALLSSLPTYALADVHVYRPIKDVASLAPGTTYHLRNVRVLGVYEYGAFEPGHRCRSHYVRNTSHKLLLNCYHTFQLPAAGSVVLLFGTIRHRQVYTGNRTALMAHVLVKFWHYVLNAQQTELQLLAKADCLPAHIYKRIVPVDLGYVTDDPQTGTDNALVIDQLQLDENFYCEFERLSSMEVTKIQSGLE